MHLCSQKRLRRKGDQSLDETEWERAKWIKFSFMVFSSSPEEGEEIKGKKRWEKERKKLSPSSCLKKCNLRLNLQADWAWHTLPLLTLLFFLQKGKNNSLPLKKKVSTKRERAHKRESKLEKGRSREESKKEKIVNPLRETWNLRERRKRRNHSHSFLRQDLILLKIKNENQEQKSEIISTTYTHFLFLSSSRTMLNIL